jgi:hypothetical protein
MAPREISAEVGISAQAVSNIVYRHGLAEVRRRNESRALARAEDRAQAEAAEFLESVTPQAMEAAEHGFALARTDDPKGFAMAMKGTQIAVQLARQGLGLDASGAAAAARGQTLAIVFGATFPEASEPIPVKAEPVSEYAILEFADDDLRDSGESAEETKFVTDTNDLQNGERSNAPHNSSENRQVSASS